MQIKVGYDKDWQGKGATGSVAVLAAATCLVGAQRLEGLGGSRTAVSYMRMSSL